MNIRIIAALRTAAIVATVVACALAVNLITIYFSTRAIGVAVLVVFVGFFVHMLYNTNLEELQRKQQLDKTVDH